MEVCLFVCLFVTYRCSNHRTKWAEIRHGGGDGPWRFVGGYDQATPHPVGVTGRGQRMLFKGKTIKKMHHCIIFTKVKNNITSSLEESDKHVYISQIIAHC